MCKKVRRLGDGQSGRFARWPGRFGTFHFGIIPSAPERPAGRWVSFQVDFWTDVTEFCFCPPQTRFSAPMGGDHRAPAMLHGPAEGRGGITTLHSSSCCRFEAIAAPPR